MSLTQKNFAVVIHQEADPHLFQRVVRVVGIDGEIARIAFGTRVCEVPKECLRSVSNVTFEVGDSVNSASGIATIRDVIWHFKNGVPNYYLEREGKRLSRRYLAEELTPQ